MLTSNARDDDKDEDLYKKNHSAHWQAGQYALDGGGEDARAQKGRQPEDPEMIRAIELFHEAAKSGNYDMVVSLVKESGMPPDARDRKGWTPLIRAAKSGSVRVLQFLLTVRADTNMHTKQGNTALHKAAKRGKYDVVQALIRAKAVVDAHNRGGATPLMLAAMQRSAEDAVKLLVEAHANVNAQKDVGYSALMLAARQGNTQGVLELIRSLADLEVRDNLGETALAKAQKHKRMEVAQVLLQHGAQPVAGKVAGSERMHKHDRVHRSDHRHGTSGTSPQSTRNEGSKLEGSKEDSKTSGSKHGSKTSGSKDS